jgi:hypothetical protein
MPSGGGSPNSEQHTDTVRPIRWPTSSTPVPPGTCLIHGPFIGSACPTCSTGGNIPTQQTVNAVTAEQHADTVRRLDERCDA